MNVKNEIPAETQVNTLLDESLTELTTAFLGRT